MDTSQRSSILCCLLSCWLCAGSAEAAEHNGTRDEDAGTDVVWLTVEPGVFLGAFSHPIDDTRIVVAGGLALQLFQLRWPHVYWSIIDAAGFFGPELYGFRLASVAGLPLDFGDRQQHHLRIGLGIGFGASVMDVDYEALGLVLVPGVGYLHEARSGFLVGALLNTTIHATGADDGQIVFSVAIPLGYGRP